MLDHSITINAETVDEAIAKGLADLGIVREEAEIRVINEGKKGFLGFGRQDAVVVISRKNNQSLSELTDALEAEMEAKKAPNSAITQPNQSESTDVIENNESYSSENEKQVDESTLSKEEVNPQVEEDFEENEAMSDQDIETSSSFKDKNEADDKETTGPDLHKASHIVANFLIDVIEEYGANADIEVEQNNNQVIFNIDTDKSGLIIGRHGKIINSLQVLAQTLLHHHYRHRTNVTLNVGDYRDRRANILEQMAKRTADEVLKTKQPVILDSLPAYERKQIHAHLSKIDHIQTHSEGKDPNRYLVVEYVNE
ncbi:Jag N-terminal domain-containing protein [Ignavigranum ruoffiae]|uniref:RNA-binding cell elongation regulator Jag/EloR n=1 Tax=Ignavigranum ruoffiae TaxID=89093 RepID=UPI00206FCD79|nr:RNA-binding cell elongation regulator Jag/EloR [Ignavigranum ruoffiae]UPQ86383.1 Jag N-terminal domain-containing protein [Ignavigranum ruoffiae]